MDQVMIIWHIMLMILLLFMVKIRKTVMNPIDACCFDRLRPLALTVFGNDVNGGYP